MKVATAFSTKGSAEGALDQTYGAVCAQLGAAPDFVVLSYTEPHDAAELARAAAALPQGVRVHGASSCRGAMTAEGLHVSEGPVLAMLGISDPEGAFGVACEPLQDEARQASARAARRAIADADRAGESPSLIWLSTAPGTEEQALLGIADVVGANVPVFGGSAADNAIQGGWSQLTRGSVQKNGIVVSALYPAGEVSYAFSSGYAPTAARGRVTRASARRILEIDGEPAALVYDRWTGGAIQAKLGGGDILAESTMQPLGRVAATLLGVEQYLLIHPSGVDADRGMTVFADVAPGDELVLMTGSKESLIGRVRGVVEAARLAAPPRFVAAGALVIYCAGCMLAVQEQMDEVVRGLRQSLGATPFLGAFTFGEQGCVARGSNRHGNLGISVVLLGSGS